MADHDTLDDVAEPTAPEHAPRQDRQTLQREIIDFVKLVVWFLIIFLALRTYVIEGYEVQGDSMNPNLVNNERILVLKLPHILSKSGFFGGVEGVAPGDIVVFDSPDAANKRYVKRVIAKGPKGTSTKTVDAESMDSQTSSDGVHVQFNRGKVYVDNHLYEEAYLSDEARISFDIQMLTLGPGEYYVLGDNRPVSKDSRSFKAIDDDRIIGKAIIRFWPPSRIGLIH